MTTLSSGRPTMVDVARQAHVSLKTVSRVVNEEPGVRPETEQRVRDAIAELGFRRNDGARQLRRGRTASIGLIVEDLANPFYSALAASCERVARLRRHLLITASAEGSAEREESLAGALLARRVDGLIVVPAAPEHGWLRTELSAGMPVVFVDRPATGVEADTVLADNEGGIRSAVEHLAAHGHRRIGFLGDDPAFWTAQRRRDGFVSAVEALGLPCVDLVAMGPHDVDELRRRVQRWTSDGSPVTALVTGNNRVTIALLRALRSVDVTTSLVGFDDFELADLLDPAITVVTQDPAMVGEAAANLLFARIDGDTSAPQQVVLPTQLIVRESGRAV
ncbi:MAG: LacI family DNA-binding transcriptional regulator [Nocardioidaceae bacterium]